ncbi:MAG TPA: UDP-N-acetylglucosamine 2-epimerase (non-hydrolyzing) [Draconibacterium sp.]|nr:UDP-N-acetylglucosamine 2-epimerase (non-hydrolyzing) [Draconibacterium sp.]
MKQIVTIVGARPQFIKAAVLSRLIRSGEWKDKFTEVLVHTGQHYDQNMSEVFFNDMDIPKPDYNLNVGSGTHGKMTGEMLIKIEEVLLNEKPDIVLVYGDTNSTLAGALAAGKLHIPVAHVEAGLRSFWKKMPEEQNRILTDHLADWLFCPTVTAVKNLKMEGITIGVENVGDIMLDANIYYKKRLAAEKEHGISRLKNSYGLNDELINNSYVLATVHRAENTDDPVKLAGIVEALNALGSPVILPLHPRTKKLISAGGLTFNDNVTVIEPVGYFEMLELEMNCTCILTDSGGVQKEAYFMQKPCVTLREQTEWVETVESGWNKLAGTNTSDIISAVNQVNSGLAYPEFYGKGNTGSLILNILDKRQTLNTIDTQ